MNTRASRSRAIVATAASFAMVLGVFSGALSAAADTAPPNPADPSTPPTVSADGLPTAQIDGVAWSQVIVGNTVWVAGSFQTARPAGAAPGTNTVPRHNLLAYNLTTGTLINSFAPDLNGQALSIAASPDGSRVYVTGDFTQIDGQWRVRAAAFNTATMQVDPAFAPVLSSQGRAITATSSTVYVGGNFTNVSGVARNYVAALDPATGAVKAGFTAGVDNAVNALVATTDNSKLVIGGRFNSLNGTTARGLGAVNATTGATVPWEVNKLVYASGSRAGIMSLYATPDAVYGTAWAWGKSDGNLEGIFNANPNNGAIQWIDDCHGDTYSVYPMGDAVYSVGHAHYCGNIGGFPQPDPWVFHRALAVSKAVTGTITPDPYGYFNFAGQPRPSLLNWFPTIDAGTYTGQNQGPWHVTGNGQYIVQGGEFRTVNGVAQQGLVRFALPSIAPNKIGPQSNDGLTPSVVSFKAGEVRVSWQATHDRDNANLTYRVTRDGNVVYETKAISNFWTRPIMGFADKNLVPGSRHLYRVFAYDPFNNMASRSAIYVDVATADATSGYEGAVMADNASAYWPLDEASGASAFDHAGFSDLQLQDGVTRGVSGPVPGHTASRFDGTSSEYGSTQAAIDGPASFTEEVWIRTTTTRGGKILGFGSSATGNSGSYDRHIYMDNAGRVYFGVYPGAIRTINSAAAFNNGQWHQIVASVGSNGMRLWVDGTLVASRNDVTTAQNYSGYWRVGGDNLNSWTSQPRSAYFAGDIGSVSIYPTVLSGTDIIDHYNATGRGSGPNAAPTAAFTSSVNNLTASFNGGGSNDTDGTINGYSWNFGDGQTATTGATTSHSYAAAGTYTVTLTVTDDDGATGSVSHPVTVTAPPAPVGFAQDAFGRTVASGWGNADAGGAWSTTGTATNYSVAGGAGLMTNAAGQTLQATLPSVSSSDTELSVQVSIDKAMTGGGEYLSVIGRKIATDDYRARVRFLATGEVILQLVRGGTTLSSITVPGLTYTAGDQLQIVLQVTGTNPTTIRAKVWPVGGTEPATWQASVTDNTAALQVAGWIGLEAFISGSTTNAPITTRFDNLVAKPTP